MAADIPKHSQVCTLMFSENTWDLTNSIRSSHVFSGSKSQISFYSFHEGTRSGIQLQHARRTWIGSRLGFALIRFPYLKKTSWITIKEVKRKETDFLRHWKTWSKNSDQWNDQWRNGSGQHDTACSLFMKKCISSMYLCVFVCRWFGQQKKQRPCWQVPSAQSSALRCYVPSFSLQTIPSIWLPSRCSPK